MIIIWFYQYMIISFIKLEDCESSLREEEAYSNLLIANFKNPLIKKSDGILGNLNLIYTISQGIPGGRYDCR